MKLVIATQNVHKVREFRAFLKRFSFFDIYSLADFPTYAPLPEDGETFDEIAKTKARHAAKAIGEWVLADDSGLVVPALGGAPGIFSARYAGGDATDLDNRKKLLKEMQHLDDIARAGYFHCTLALASPEGFCKTVSGQCEGRIGLADKGRHGFGYDPLFIKHDYNQTFAQLDEATKNRISHRAKAMQKLELILESLERDLDENS